MARDLSVVAEEGIKACASGDRVRAMILVAEVMMTVDLEHTAADAVCRLYADALAGLAAGEFDAARVLFQSLRAA